MKTEAGTTIPFPSILRFPSASNSAARRVPKKDLLKALRLSGSAPGSALIIVDLSNCSILNHEDIDLLLECAAQVAGRDTHVRFVAGSRVNRILLEVTRISTIVPVFDSITEALAYPRIATKIATQNDAGDANDADDPALTQISYGPISRTLECLNESDRS